jgi:uncharacterized delta-60 repeat protein
VRSWSVSKVEQGIGKVVVASGAQQGGLLRKDFDLGPAPFNEDRLLPPQRATASVLSTASGAQYNVLAEAPGLNPFVPNSPKGGVTHLDEYQAYEKQSADASLRITISRVILDAIDDNEVPIDSTGNSTLPECPLPALKKCNPVRAVVRFHARAYAESAGGDFFDVGGAAYIEGMHEGLVRAPAPGLILPFGVLAGGWSFHAVTSSDSQAPLWGRRNFLPATFFFNDPATLQAHSRSELDRAISLKVPLDAVRDGELFAVHVSLDAEAINDRGGEADAEAFIQDPQHGGPPLLKIHGLTPRGKPMFKEPVVTSSPAARCPAGPARHAGSVQLSAPAFDVVEGTGTPLVLVTRKGGSHGAVSVTVRTSGGSAQAGRDFRPTTTRVTFGRGDTSPRLVEIPILEDRVAEPPEKFTVSLANPRCGKLGGQRGATVTIFDDDTAPPAPAPEFTIGGTVDGLQGSGLVLSNLGSELPVSANGSFTLPGTHPTGDPYTVNVKTQPHNPDQVCTVEHGTGQVSSSNVTDIAVHCTTSVIPSGLDSTFGDNGRVTTPGNGEGRAVLIQPDGKIVTVGAREVGVNFHFQFGATRHDANGNLDPSFGTGGIATTPLGGNDDKARDAALLPDGGFVAVGQADPAGLANVDFGVVRYTADGHPDPSFNSTGVETTDIAGRGDVANAVAVQPDGKIVAAGEAETAPGFFDFAVVRYNTDGTLDTSFDGDGIVTTDLGSEFDDATAVAIQSDGKIVVAGDTEQNVALARYLPNGKLDPTFNAGGTVVSNIGTNEANGVAITPGGTILIAGTRVGPRGDRDPFVASYGPSGKLNLGFGTFGVAQADLSGGEDFGEDLTLDANGNIVVVGSASSATVSDMALARFKPDGTIDTTLTTDFHGTGDFGNALAIDPQGRIVAAGTSGDQFALMRATL